MLQHLELPSKVGSRELSPDNDWTLVLLLMRKIIAERWILRLALMIPHNIPKFVNPYISPSFPLFV